MCVPGARADDEHFPCRPHDQSPTRLTRVRLVSGQKRAGELEIDSGAGARVHGPRALITDGLLRAMIVQSDQATSPLLGLVLPLQAAKVLDKVLDEVSPNFVHRVRRYVRCFV